MIRNKDMALGTVYDSCNYGRFTIIEYFSATNVKVEFIDTGFVSNVEAGDIRKGNVKDRSDAAIGSIYNTNSCGKIVIKSGPANRLYDIEFIDTGYKRRAKLSDIKLGRVKDKLKPVVFGVGFIGGDKHKAKNGKTNTKKYNAWSGMLERCYCPKTQARQPTYKGVTVCDDWHDYQVFSEWYEENYIEGCHLDKDIKIDGNKIYSPSTCLFVTPKENVIKATAKSYNMTSPQGKKVIIYNMAKFCREKNLTQGAMSQVHIGNSLSHKGWTRA